jgi:ubiquinone/menaquinone biosynthesis C-methylase UbiE
MKSIFYFDDLVTKTFNLVFGQKDRDWCNLWRERIDTGSLVELEDPFQQKVYAKTHKRLKDIFGTVEGKGILEVGAGSGYASMLFAQEGVARITLLDKSIDALRYARLLADRLELSNRVEFIHGDCKRLPLSSDSFDIVHSTGVIEHFSDEDIVQILSECQRVMRKDGKVAMIVPNLVSLEILARIMKTKGKGTERHLSKSRLEALFRVCKFRDIKVGSTGASGLPYFVGGKSNTLSRLADGLAPFDYLRTVSASK